MSYKKTEKWWLILVVLFYGLYNLPGVPEYGNAKAALWHGALTIIPLWIIIYGGLFLLFKQQKLKITETNSSSIDEESKEGENQGV